MAPPPNSRHPSIKARKMQQAQQEDPRFRHIDRMLARAYIELLKKRKLSQQKPAYSSYRMDLCDDPANTHITAMLEVPGMKPEQLSVRIEGGRLIVEGNRPGPYLHGDHSITNPNTHPLSSEPTQNASSEHETSTPHPLYPVQELKYGKFRREIDLPVGVNASDIRSSLVEGMLTIQWPRNPPSTVAAGSSANVSPHATL
ncbi:hypothetical protein BD310DRAFT_924320 [Dichomitus squalens]|uniref:SHSP domain-containing protein n=2 Tax=Dichomitus squalens TaxID=114155 RepID=A0A4Q9PYR5_9APHY|nr:hypothetical protein BD310DRAFT_924320 [Dichomitus squalens]